MANPSKKKGTNWEVELLGPLRELFGPQVERSTLSGIYDYGDFVGVPHLIEAKSTTRPMFQEWARKCEKKAGKNWAIIWHGDRRVQTGTGPYVVMPIELWSEMVRRLSALKAITDQEPGCWWAVWSGPTPHQLAGVEALS